MSNKYLGPLCKQQKQPFFGKLRADAIKVLRVMNGKGSTIYLIGQF